MFQATELFPTRMKKREKLTTTENFVKGTTKKRNIHEKERNNVILE